MNTNPWIITPIEHQQNEIQFITLQPLQGFVSGDNARALFLKSGLPTPILAQIWSLADLNKDGRMDKLEFSIAMRLIRNCLAGIPLPPILPDSLKQISTVPQIQPSPIIPPMISSMHPPPPGPMGIPIPGTVLPSSVPLLPMRPSQSSTLGTKELNDWTIPQHNKLRYSQQFNQLDRNRVGLLTGNQARGVLGESQLPTNILAEIWNLSDVNKDGCLSIEEFIIAMHFVDMAKQGYLLPKITPPELLAFCHVRGATASPVVNDPNVPPAQKTPSLKTFEDKRRDNFDKGQAELERRRQILMEEEERRKAELQKKEREEAERRERERLELERRREAEREAELQRQKEREEARMAEEARLKVQREEAKQKLEQERLKDLEKIRIRDLENQKQAELEKTAQIQQRHKTMNFQLQALHEKAEQLNGDITKSRDEIIAITSEIEGMREQRDQKLVKINELQQKSQQISIMCERVSHEHLQLQTECRKSFSRGEEIENLRKRIISLNDQIVQVERETNDTKSRLETQEKLVNEKKPEFESYNEKVGKIVEAYNSVWEKWRTKQEVLHNRALEKARAQQATTVNSYNQGIKSNAFMFDSNFSNQPNASNGLNGPSFKENSSFENNQTPAPINVNQPQAGTIKYRALYEFVARSEDELSLQPGDVILVFENHASEPGWLAGQIKDKVGWFPAAFAEPILAHKKPISVSNVPTSPSTEPLESITEEPANLNEKDISGDFTNALESVPSSSITNGSFPTTTTQPRINSSIPSAVYDDIPSEVEPPTVDKSSKEVTPITSTESSLGTATALYQWKARNDTELSFSKGDQIEILEQGEMRWRGRLQKRHELHGWFPKSYVKMNPTSENTTAITSQQSVESVKTIEKENLSSPEKLLPKDYDKGFGEWYTALYQFDAVEENDLSLKPGDKIWVLETKDAWWKGTLNGKTGIFPANYVHKDTGSSGIAATHGHVRESLARAVAAFEATAANQISLKVGDIVKIRSISPAGWWEGEVDRSGEKHTGWFPGNYVQIIPENQGTDHGNPTGMVLADALYDYTNQQDDELSFKAGETIEVHNRTDPEWWKGRKQGETSDPLLFPSNFVQLRVVSRPVDDGQIQSQNPTSQTNTSTKTSSEYKLNKQTQELIDTEQRFFNDLLMVRALFKQNLEAAIGEAQVAEIFLNWDQLIRTSKRIHSDLLKYPPGEVFVHRIDSLEEFVRFCERQQSAIDKLNELEKNDTNFKKAYVACCQQEYARGVTLSYYLLLPMARITRYPLIFEKMLKYSNTDDPYYETLHNAFQLLKALCARVNQTLTEVENKNMLYWSQMNIKCDAIKPTLEFTSQTRRLGPRSFLHSGILYKVKSNKLLVVLLYNDFLLFSTPQDSIEQPDLFKMSKNSEVTLNLYKMPYLLENLSIVNHDELNFSLKSGDTLLQLRAPNRNAKILWVNQLQKAIDECDIALQLKKAQKNNPPMNVAEVGCLLVEISGIRDLDSTKILRYESCRAVFCRLGLVPNASSPLDEVKEYEIDIRKEKNLLSTKLPLHQIHCFFKLSLFNQMHFRPDIKLGEIFVPMHDLVTASAGHHGPLIKTMKLQNSDIPFTQTPSIDLKFVIQLFD